MHFKQVYPLHSNVVDYIKRAKKTVIIENNPNGQFSKLIEGLSYSEIDIKIFNYTGYTFSVEELYNKMKNIMEELK